MKSVVACDTCGEGLDTVPGLGLVCANGCSFDYTKPRKRGREVAPADDAVRSCAQCDARLGRLNSDTLCVICRDAKPLKVLPPVTQRVCSTPGCGRVLSQGTAGNRCRTCYESQSVAGQQRAANVEPVAPESPQASRRVQESQEQDRVIAEIAEVVSEVVAEPVPISAAEKNPAAVLLGTAGGKKGGKARAASMTPEQRRESAQKAANTRWQREEPVIEAPVPVRAGRPPGSPVDPILVEYLSAGPRSKQDIAEEVERHGLSIHQAENARQRLGIQSYYDKEQRMSLWSLDGHDSNEGQPVMTAQRDREKVTVERERVTITAAEGSIKTVALKGGGHITVNIVADIFRLTTRDRELVLGLVDSLNAFEQGKPPPSFHHCACEHYKVAAEAAIEMSDGADTCMVCGTYEFATQGHKLGCAQAVLEDAGVGS